MPNQTAPSIEDQLLERYRRGETEQAFQDFVAAYQPRLYALSYRMLGNHDDAMDALQEAFLRIHKSLASFRGESSLYTWSYRITSNVCLTFRKRRQPKSDWSSFDDTISPLLQPIERPNEDPDKMCETKYRQFLVQQALLQLPEAQRVALILHDLDGISLSDVAEILAIPLGAVKSRLHRGKAALRRIIEQGVIVKGMEGVGSSKEYHS